jgi:hypothetical protein
VVDRDVARPGAGDERLADSRGGDRSGAGLSLAEPVTVSISISPDPLVTDASAKVPVARSSDDSLVTSSELPVGRVMAMPTDAAWRNSPLRWRGMSTRIELPCCSTGRR